MGGIAALADDSPGFADNTPLSPTALNLMRDTVLAVDEASRLGGVVFCGSYGHLPEWTAEQNQIIWRGGNIYLSGVATLRITTYTTGTVVSGDTLRVYRGDDDSVYTDHTIAGGTQTHNITISGAGYSHEQAVRVRCEVRHTAKPPDTYNGCFVEVVLVELLTVSLASPPTNPTFSTAADLTATKLTQLADFLDWMVRRCALRFDPLFISQIKRIGPWHDLITLQSEPDVMWRGGFRRTLLHTTLRCRGTATVLWTGATERIRVFVNGTVVATYSVPTAIGEHSWQLDVSTSGYSDGLANRVVIQYERTAGGDLAGTINKWTVREVQLLGPSGSPSVLAAWDIRQASVSDAAALAWVQSLRSIAQAAYDRIAANGGFWAYQRAFTARPAYDDDQFEKFEPWAMPLSWGRAGEALLLRGKGLTLGYGPGRFVGEQNEVGAEKIENFKTAQLIDADSVETSRFYLDTAQGLPVGAPFNVRGVECYVAFEQLKVVEDA